MEQSNHLHIILFLLFGIFTSFVFCQDALWSNLISRVPEGVAGVDYPDYTVVPKRTSFTCRNRKPGFYADPETRCQGWHWCDTFLIKHSFLCGNMTVFNQKIRGCDWWYNVNCDLAVSQYINNDELYQSGEEQEEQRRQRDKKESRDRHPVSNDLGASQSVNDVSVTGGAARQPGLLDYDDTVFVASTAAPVADTFFAASTAAPIADTFFAARTAAPAADAFFGTQAAATIADTFFAASTATPSAKKPSPTTDAHRIFLSTNPTTRGVIRAQPTVRPQTPVRNIFVRPNTGGFQINIANAIPIVFPPPPPKKPLQTTSQPTTLNQHSSSNGIASQSHSFGVTSGIVTELPTTLVTKPRRRLRFRTQPVRVTTAAPAFNTANPFPPSVANPEVIAAPHFSGVAFAPPIGVPAAHDAFLAPLDAPTTAVVQDLSPHTEPPTFPSVRTTTSTPTTQQLQSSRFPEFPPFPGTTARGSGFRPLFQSFGSTTGAALQPSSSDRPTVPFNFGIPFGARIKPTDNLEQAATVRRSDTFLPAPSTAILVDAAPRGETTAAPFSTPPFLRRRKFVQTVKTFPPFPVTTSTLKVTKVSPKESFQESSTTIVDNSAFYSGGSTQKPTKHFRKTTPTESSSSQTSDFPEITTFRPSINLTTGDDLGILPNSTSSQLVSLHDDISLA